MLVVGVLWIVVMTLICYVGIEISANFQKALLALEVTMLVVLSVVALVKVAEGLPRSGTVPPRGRGWARLAVRSPISSAASR